MGEGEGSTDLSPEAAQAERLFDEVLADTEPSVPRATYRVQLHAGFTFEEARRRVDYLAALGVSHLYASPFFKARPGSTHGYDLCDHNALNPEIGTRADLDALSGALAARGMGILLDFVPNHMGIETCENLWWQDVLENGPSSLYAPFFDIDWAPVKAELRNKVLLPVLGDHYGRVLEAGELRLEQGGGAFSLRFHDHVFPINPRTYPVILEPVIPDLAAALGEEHEAILELQSIITGLRHLPPRSETRRARVIERSREKEILKRRLAALLEGAPEVAAAVRAEVARLNGTVGDPRSFDALDALLEQQAYRLGFWRTAAEEINYRRFFDINDLAAIRMENPAVFAAAHRLLFELAGGGVVSGLRIDHPDGLWDPNCYLHDVQRGYVVERCRRWFLESAAAGGDPRAAQAAFARLVPHLEARFERMADAAPPARPLYVVVEKILARGETLPEGWPVHGTSGYDFAAGVTPLFVDATSEAQMTEIYERFIGRHIDFESLVQEAKRVILRTSLSSELSVLAHALNRLTEQGRHLRDFTLGSLTFGLREVIACFPVYRTYIHERTEAPSDHDRVAVQRAVGLARRYNPTAVGSVLTFLRALLTLELPAGEPPGKPAWRDFVMRFQELTGPVMAKGLEDTAFYIYNRLVSLNEVGGEPERYGSSVAAFHRASAQRQRAWPSSMLATTTHDTKRSEDVRARINVLSELPSQWQDALARASAAAAPLRTDNDGRLAPDRNEEYLFYQTVLGSLPVEATLAPPGAFTEPARAEYADRIAAYMRKATKEAKVNTSWVEPRPEHDAAVESFVRRALASPAVMDALDPLARTVAYHGMWGSLAQVLLKLTSPGVPDIYQGNELWDLSLVDPDNRRPVDFEVREAALASISERRAALGGAVALARDLLARALDGRIKLLVTHVALDVRRRYAALFAPSAAYVPVAVGGEREGHIIAYARRAGDQEVVVVAPRLVARLMEGRLEPPVGSIWAGTWISVDPGSHYVDAFTGARVASREPPADASARGMPRPPGAPADAPLSGALPVELVLGEFPVALLVRE